MLILSPPQYDLVNDYFFEYKEKYEKTGEYNTFPDDFKNYQNYLSRQKARYQGIVKRFFGIYDGGLVFRINTAEHINADLEKAINLVIKGQWPSKVAFYSLFDTFKQLLDLITLHISVFEAIQAHGLVSGIVSFSWDVSKNLLKDCTDKLKKLRAALDKAKKEKKEALAQAVLDKTLTVVTFVAPEVGVLTSLAIDLGKLGYDKLLGPSGPDNYAVAETTATSFIDKATELGKLSETAGTAFKNAITVVSTVKNISENGLLPKSEYTLAKENVENLDAMVKDTSKSLQKLMGNLNEVKVNLIRFKQQVGYFKTAISSDLNKINDQLKTVDENLKAVNYHEYYQWKVENWPTKIAV